MRFSQDFIERVREASNLVDIIAQYTQLKPAGQGFMGRCPFPDHPEKTASFSVSEAKQVYHCFGCKKSGNIFSFLQDYNGMSFVEAIEYLADRSHIPIPQMDDAKMEQEDLVAKKKRQILNANRVALDHFINNLKKLSPAHPLKAYLEKRNLTNELVETFHLGYSTDEWDSLCKNLEAKGVPLPIADEARLIKPRKEGKTGYFDLFRDRLMFPILNSLGEPLAFGGRIIQQGEPKYLNSPETPVFFKGKVLYGLSQTAKYVRAEDQIIIVEGYMDLISLFGAGLCHIAATMGTALTADHAKIISRLTKNVVVLFDGDSAGQEAAERSLPLLLAGGLLPKGLILPDDLDPDDFVQTHGVEKLREHIAEAKDLFVVILSRWMDGYRNEASEKVRLADRLRPLFNAMSDIRLRDLYLQIVCERMGVTKQWLVQALQQPQGSTRSMPAKPMQKQVSESHASVSAKAGPLEEKISFSRAPHMEINLLGLVLKNRANLEAFCESNTIDFVTHEGIKILLTKSMDSYRQDPETFDKLVSLFSGLVDKPELLLSATLKTDLQSFSKSDSSDPQGDAESRLLQDCMRKIREQFIQKQSSKLATELKIDSSSSEKQNETLKKIMELHKSRLSINTKN